EPRAPGAPRGARLRRLPRRARGADRGVARRRRAAPQPRRGGEARRCALLRPRAARRVARPALVGALLRAHESRGAPGRLPPRPLRARPPAPPPRRRFAGPGRPPAELRREVPDAALRAGRRASAFFGALACAALALTAAAAAGLAAGLVAGLLLLANESFATV